MENIETMEASMEAAMEAAMHCRHLEAAEHAKKALDIMDAECDPDKKRLFDILGLLAMVQHYAGNYEDSEMTYGRLLELAEEMFGRNSNEYTEVCSDISLLYVDAGRYTDAEPFIWHAIENYKSRLRHLYVSYAEALDNLAECMERCGKDDQAFEYVREAVDVLGRDSSVASDHLIYPLRRLARLYRRSGEVEKAADAQRQADEIYKSVTDMMARFKK